MIPAHRETRLLVGPQQLNVGGDDTMVMDADTIATVVESGDTDDINDLIDEIESLDVPAQLELFEESFEALLDCMDHEDGYSRQAVVRIVSALDPSTGRMAVETAPEQFETVPEEARFAEAIDRESTLFVAALTDDDGRVRRAAIRGLNSLAVGCRLSGDYETLDRLADDIESLSVSEQKRDHVEEALDKVRGGIL